MPFSIVIHDPVLRPGCSFAGIEKSMGRRTNHRRGLEELHAKTNFRMVGVRSICEMRLSFLETH